MAVSTTFGYNAAEDRLWMSCDAWPQRIWLTRRIVAAVLEAAVQAIEDEPTGDDTLDARARVERAAAEHDASLNRPQPGEQGHALKMGRESSDARELATAELCTRFALTRVGARFDLGFGSAAGERRLQLSRTGLHRWLHALHLVLAPAQWGEWTVPPDWLTRSYLPPALKLLLHAPPVPPEDD